jgi:phage replication O-like protein O
VPKGDYEILKADIEDGYTRVANLLLEAFAMAQLSGIQKGICLFIIRRTYSWGKSEDAISLREFAQACGTSEPYVSRQLKDLIDKNVVKRLAYKPGKPAVYTINTRVADWCKGCINIQELHESAVQGLYKCTREGLYKCTRVNQPEAPVAQEPATPLKKDLKKVKDNIYIYPSDSIPYTLAEHLQKCILQNLPDFKKPNLQKWAKDIDLMIRIDKRPPPDIKALIEWAQSDPFWRANILSTSKLRKQYDTLNAQRKRGETYGPGTGIHGRISQKVLYREEERENPDAWRIRKPTESIHEPDPRTPRDPSDGGRGSREPPVEPQY